MCWQYDRMSRSFRSHRSVQAGVSHWFLNEDDENLALCVLLLFENVGQSDQSKDQRNHHQDKGTAEKTIDIRVRFVQREEGLRGWRRHGFDERRNVGPEQESRSWRLRSLSTVHQAKRFGIDGRVENGERELTGEENPRNS